MKNYSFESSGYDLVEGQDGYWKFGPRGGPTSSGDIKLLAKHMISDFGFNIDDIESAVEMMLSCGHSGVHFGMYKTPIFTFDANKKVA